MKNKKSYRKYTVAGLSFLIVASVLGSAAGTVAWYQYSTRTSAYINGADGSCTKNLQMIIGEVELDDQGKEAKSYDWGSDFTFADIKEYIRDTLNDDKIADNYGTIAPVSNYRSELGEKDLDDSYGKEGDKYINTSTSVLFTKEGDSWKKAKLMTTPDDTKNTIQVDMGGTDKTDDETTDSAEIGDLYLNEDGKTIFSVVEKIESETTTKVWKKKGYLFDLTGDGTPDASLGIGGNTYYDKTNKKAYQKTVKASNEDEDATETQYEWTELTIDYTYDPYVVGGIENLSNLNSDSPLGKFYSTLRYQDADLKDYDSPVASDYIQFPVTLKLKDVKTNKNSEERTDVYLEDLQINTWDSSSKEKNDLKDNFRVHYSAVSQEVVTDEAKKVSLVNDEEKDTLLNVMDKKVEENELTNYTYGPLDLNGDSQFDTSKYTYSKSETLIYGVNGTKQTSAYYSDIKPTVTNGKYNNTGKAIGTIPDNGYLKVMVTVWLDGWSKNTVNPEKTVDVVTKKNTLAENETALDLAVEEWVAAANEEEELKNASPSDADKIAKATEKTASKRTAATTALTAYRTAFLAYSTALKNTIDSTLPEEKAWTDQFDALVDSTDKKAILDKFEESNKAKTISTIVSSFTGYDKLTKAYETLVNNSIGSWDGAFEKSLYEVGMTFGVSADF